MHKSVYNEATVRLVIEPVGPILIKAGGDNADPARPDMSFVRTFRDGRETVYLPGSSLKGVLRAHCERLARTIDNRFACDPLSENSCGKRLEKEERGLGGELSGAQKHKRSCFLCKMFGNTRLASHFRITDAYPARECRTEERNGVAIDRVFGSVAVGPFNYETITDGSFETKLQLKNFTLPQLGMLALVLRDLAQERVRLGFAKSRGLGLVRARVEELTLHYHLCELKDDQLLMLGRKEPLGAEMVYGVGAFVKVSEDATTDYGYPQAENDMVILPEGYCYVSDSLLGVEVSAPGIASGGVDWQPLGRACVSKWREEVVNG